MQLVLLMVANGCQLTPYLVNTFNSADVSACLQEALNDNIDVLNMSFGGTGIDPIVSNWISNCASFGRPNPLLPGSYLGMVLVAASGNTDAQLINYPAGYDKVISVGMSNPNDYRSSQANGWSQNPGDGSTYGPPTFGNDIVAPGEIIITTDLQGSLGNTGDYVVTSGTSASAPIVSGIAAILLEKNSQLTNVQIADLIRNGADKTNPSTYNYNAFPSAAGYSLEMAYGRVNCFKSLTLVDQIVGLEDEEIMPMNYSLGQIDANRYVFLSEIDNTVANLQVYNSVGQKENCAVITNSETKSTIELINVPSGIFFIRIVLENGQVLNYKILK